MKERYAEHIRKTHQYQTGDHVYLRDQTGIVGISRKLQPEYYGDVFEVVEVSGEHKVRLKNTITGKDVSSIINVDRLKPVIGREPPRQTGNNEEKGDNTTVATGSHGEKEDSKQQGNSTTNQQMVDGQQNPDLGCINREIAYRIVEQKGSGDKRRFRIQWKGKDGRSSSCWETWNNVPRETMQQWERTHGKAGKTLKTFRRTRCD